MRFINLLFALCLLSSAAVAQSQSALVPERRIAISENVDFPGGDLSPIFETDFNTCRATCLADRNCGAFTFNARSNACFPKTGSDEVIPFEGAISARVFATNPLVRVAVPKRAAELSFLRPEDLTNARGLAIELPQLHVTGEWSVGALLDAARDARASGAPLSALRFTGAALVVTDAADQWVEYARLALSLEGDTRRQTRNWRTRAFQAAINGYLRSDSPAIRASALVAMAAAVEDLGRGRDMIPALRLSNALSPRRETQEALDAAVAKHGFRVVEHKVESESAAPRVCMIFSEDLQQAGVTYADYLRTPLQGLAVEADGRQLCIDGVEHGARYQFALRQGLPAASGEVLSKTVDLDIYVRDRSPTARFPGRGYVLPAGDVTALPIVTVNVNTLDLVLRKVGDRTVLRRLQDGSFGRPLSRWQDAEFAETQSVEIWRGTAEVDPELNVDVTTRLPLDEAVGPLAPGLYMLRAEVRDGPRDDAAASQWFVVSDLGLTSYQGNDGLTVFARSLRDVSAKSGALVRLVSQANTVLAEQTTDGSGMVQFAAGLMRGTGGAAPALITVEQGDSDFAFLSLTDPEFDLSDRGVEGRPPVPPIDLFTTTDRGAYRVGEVIRLTALARSPQVQAIADLPLTLILRRPDGAEYARQVVQSVGAGGYAADLPLGQTVPRGTWTIALHTDPDAVALTTTTVLVEDFLPERLAVELSLPEGLLYSPAPEPLLIDVDYLFGAPGADLPVTGYTRLTAQRSLPAFPGFEFGRHDETVSARVESFASVQTDADGLAQVALLMPDLPARDRPVQATITVELREGNARPVERQIARTLTPTGPLLGIKPLFDGAADEGAQAGFELLGLAPYLDAIPMQVKWTLNRVETRYQWYQLSGRWEWEPITRRTRIATGEVMLGRDGPTQIEAPVDWGRYELEVERLDGTYLASSIGFYAGWYGGGDASATPDLLSVSLDQPQYRVGEMATLRLSPRRAGTALVSVLADSVVSHQFVEVAAGESEIALEVTPDWGTGAYVTATLLTPTSGTDQMPTRAMGLAYAAVDPESRALQVTLDAPDIAPARSDYTVTLTATGAEPGQTVYATLAGVDAGILGLTGFQPPDPQGHYFGQRALGIGIRDIYGRLIDAGQGALGRVRSGGDAGAQMRMQAPPPTEDLAVYWSGPLVLDANGQAQVTLSPDGFNGTMRLMAVVWTEDGVGQASHDVITRDPVVMSATLPRFLAPGDDSLLRVELTHADGPAGMVRVALTKTGPVEFAQTTAPVNVPLAEGGRGVVEIPLQAQSEGDASLRIKLTLPGGEIITKTLALGVRANDPEVSRSQRFSLASGDVFTLDQNVFAGFKSGSGHAVLSAGGLAQFDAPGLLAVLDRYPYGCTEQITSRALPLLAAAPLARAMGLDADQTLDTRLAEAVQTVLTRQAANGAFGLWRPSSGDLWLDAYVTDFLTRARAADIPVPDLQLSLALDNLRNRVNYASDFDSGGEGIAYALMVLARDGSASMSDLRYYADVKADAFATPLALAQLGAGLAFYGDPTRADAMFRAAQRRLSVRAVERPFWRSDYGTTRRDAAAVLTLAAEAGSTALSIAPLISLATARPNDPRSTQEAAWGVMAANALVDDPRTGFTVNGAPITGSLVRVLDQDTLTPMEIATTSDRDETLVLTTYGVPEVPQPASGNGYQIDRLYFSLDGAPVQPDRVSVGTRLVTVLKVSPIGLREGRLMVTDPLPAGFEIDNPNLLRSGELKDLDFLTLDVTPTHQEFLSDRFRAAVDWRSDRAFQLAYIVRAVSPGAFAHPAALVEDMYRPQFRAITDTSRVQVVR